MELSISSLQVAVLQSNQAWLLAEADDPANSIAVRAKLRAIHQDEGTASLQIRVIALLAECQSRF